MKTMQSVLLLRVKMKKMLKHLPYAFSFFAAFFGFLTYCSADIISSVTAAYSMVADSTTNPGPGYTTGTFTPTTVGPPLSFSTSDGFRSAAVSLHRQSESLLTISTSHFLVGNGRADTWINMTFTVDSPVNALFDFTTSGMGTTGPSGSVTITGQGANWTSSRSEFIQLQPNTTYSAFLRSGLYGLNSPGNPGIATLTINTAVPEPQSFLLLMPIMVGTLITRRRSSSTTL